MTNSQQATLLALPTEARVIIYRYLFNNLTIRGDHRCRRRGRLGQRDRQRYPPSSACNIMYTCQLIYKESQTTFYNSATFTFTSQASKSALGYAFGPNLPLVRHIRYNASHGEMACTVFRYLHKHCIGLKTFDIFLGIDNSTLTLNTRGTSLLTVDHTLERTSEDTWATCLQEEVECQLPDLHKTILELRSPHHKSNCKTTIRLPQSVVVVGVLGWKGHTEVDVTMDLDQGTLTVEHGYTGKVLEWTDVKLFSQED